MAFCVCTRYVSQSYGIGWKYTYRWRRQWHPTPVLLPGKSHGWSSLVGCSPWGRWGSDTTKRLHFHFSLSCTGEGNGNPLQCSCLENPRDLGAWRAAIYGVAQSRTRLKRHSSSSSSNVTSLFKYKLYILMSHVNDPVTYNHGLLWHIHDQTISTPNSTARNHFIYR